MLFFLRGIHVPDFQLIKGRCLLRFSAGVDVYLIG
jgi:hypothetical protein